MYNFDGDRVSALHKY